MDIDLQKYVFWKKNETIIFWILFYYINTL